MNRHQWKYRIGSGKTPVILSLGMLALFGGMSVWLHRSNNGAYLFGDLLTIIMGVILVLTGYRFLFFKVLIGQDGFFYQTHVHNGRYFGYQELGKAWISTGKDTGGHEASYCHFETPEGRTIRFRFFDEDEKGVQYLVRRAEAALAHRAPEAADVRRCYQIDGKTFGVGPLITSVVLAAILTWLDIPMVRSGGLGILFGCIGLGMAAFILCYSLLNYFCFLVKIDDDGFYLQTTPFNGTYYPYSRIDRSWSVMKIYRRRRSATRQHLFYLYFTDKSGKTRRFLYSDDIFHHEIQILQERIKGSK